MSNKGTILLVDDNDDDAFFIEKAFTSAGSPAHIFRCIDGREAQHYLLAEAPFTNRGFYPMPDLILLDLKIPHLSGLELLKWVREQPALRHLIVLILTSSAQQREIDAAYDLQANCFLTKPLSPAETAELAKSITLCWMTNRPSSRAA